MNKSAEAESAFLARDYTRAKEIWTGIVRDGDASAEAWLGALYANGLGVEKNAAVAFGHYLRAAQAGNILAANNVAVMYLRGEGVAPDEHQACCWFEKAANEGDNFAQFNYATALSKGIGVEVNLKRALHWFRRGAEAGHYMSQAQLGHCYVNGLGAAVDRVEAFVWLSSASRHGVNRATMELESLVREMSVEEKAVASARLRSLAADKP